MTESEYLLPGTVVEIEIPESGARGEFLWPNIAPVMRPKRRNVVGNRPRPAQPPDPPRAHTLEEIRSVDEITSHAIAT